MAFNWIILPPVFFAGLVPTLVAVCYMNGIISGHYHFFLPVISDTGNKMPQAPLFSSSITFCGVLWMITATIRYLQLRAIIFDRRFMYLNAESHRRIIREKRALKRKTLGAYKALNTSGSSTASNDDDDNRGLMDKATGHRYPPLHPIPPPPEEPGNMHINIDDNLDDVLHFFKAGEEQKFFLNWNFFFYLVAIAAGLATFCVASFRIGESYLYHYLGGFGVIFMPPLYILFQTYFSYRFYPQVNSKKMYYTRLYTAFVTIVSVGIFFLTATVLNFWPKYAEFRDAERRSSWRQGDDGYFLHVINSLCEWTYILSLSPFIYSFTHDFSRFAFDRLKLDFPFGNLMHPAEMRKEFSWHPPMKMHRYHHHDHEDGDTTVATGGTGDEIIIFVLPKQAGGKGGAGDEHVHIVRGHGKNQNHVQEEEDRDERD